MRTVWKVPVTPSAAEQAVVLTARRGRPVAIAESADGALCMWVEVADPSAPGDEELHEMQFAVVGTGWDVPRGFAHVDTCVTSGGFVWHLYERG